MRAEEGDETVDQLADEAQQAKDAVDAAVDEQTREARPPSSQPDVTSPVDRNLDTPIDEALGGVPSPPDE
jgi:hypothetical protein